jgi:hypothetical protein
LDLKKWCNHSHPVTSHQGWNLLPFNGSHPIQLLKRLRDLVANCNTGLTTGVVTAIKACLGQDTNAAVKKVIVKHGFNGSGDCEMEYVTKQQVESMILELQGQESTNQCKEV